MIRMPVVLMMTGTLLLVANGAGAADQDSARAPAAAWPVTASLKSTLSCWAQREGWPAPQFLTEADWPVDVPGSIPGSIESALKVLVQGFGRAPSRPRIELSVNHVIVVTEAGAE